MFQEGIKKRLIHSAGPLQDAQSLFQKQVRLKIFFPHLPHPILTLMFKEKKVVVKTTPVGYLKLKSER